MALFPVATELRDATIEAARELGVFAALPCPPGALSTRLGVAPRRLSLLVAALRALGVIDEEAGLLCARDVPAPREVDRAGWGELAAVLRTDHPLVPPGGDIAARYHQHLLTAGAPAAREVAARLGATRLLDLGGGAGAYARAVIAASDRATVTLVDAPDVLELARANLPSRVTLVAGDARTTEVPPHEVALLANVLHLHGEDACAALCAAAARAVVPGGTVAIVDGWIDDGGTAPVAAAMFALNMALYTEAGAMYSAAQIRAWLERAGLVDVTVVRLADAPEMMLVTATRPIDLGVAIARPLRLVLARALALEAVDGEPQRADDLVRHYGTLMPAQRTAQLRQDAIGADILQAPLDWTRLPRLAHAIDRLFALLGQAGADAQHAMGAPTADAWRQAATSVAALYARTHYGGFMPLLYGNLPDLVYFAARGGEPHAIIDRYLTTPIVHELCHFAPERTALMPLHLDECVAGWLGVHVHPEFAYPVGDNDDAIFAAPWLSQIGQAIARAFGIAALVRAHAGGEPWESALPSAFVVAAARLGWTDWRVRRTLHFLSDTLVPEPWVALALAAGAGRDLREVTLAELHALPLAELATALPADDAFDRTIVEDGLRAMCLENVRIEGSFRARTKLPAGPIAITAQPAVITTARRGEVDVVAPRYWLPPAVAARMLAANLRGFTLSLHDLAALPLAAEAVMRATAIDAPGFVLVAVD